MLPREPWIVKFGRGRRPKVAFGRLPADCTPPGSILSSEAADSIEGAETRNRTARRRRVGHRLPPSPVVAFAAGRRR